MLNRLLAACLTVGLLCSCGQPEKPAPSQPPAPKTAFLKTGIELQPPLTTAAVSPLYRQQWLKAPNRARCAPLAPGSLGDYENARARPAFFSGGWGVAYDLPNRRSAFGVAGTGASARGLRYSAWLRERRWPDGRVASYGPEGGSGPTLLAYMTVPGQSCLYNVWSNISLDHLEYLLDQLQPVPTSP